MLLLIWADEKYNTQKNPCVVFATQKNPGVFHRPKKIPLGQNVRPKKILRTPPPPSLKYVSGAPRTAAFQEPPPNTHLSDPTPLYWKVAVLASHLLIGKFLFYGRILCKMIPRENRLV